MKFYITMLLASCCLVPTLASAQGALYVSNLSQPSPGSQAVGSDSWCAAIFKTGSDSDGYSLNSVELVIAGVSGSVTGFSIMIYNYGVNGIGFAAPGSEIGQLTGPSPTSSGIFTYAAANMLLSPLTDYYIVATSATPVANGTVNWSATGSLSYDSIDGWVIPSFNDSSSSGANWVFDRDFAYEFAINATAVPEPSPLSLILLGGAGLLCVTLRRVRLGPPIK